jgi:Zn-dependent peptidase ImmA (M78 family)
MTLRRGFKTEANEYARELRAEFGLAPYAPISPWLLAEHLGIPVMRLSELAASQPAAVDYLTRFAPEIFSAATLFAGYRRLIVYNDAHHPRRQAADLAHEISHGILGYPPSPILDEYGCRQFNRTHEEEANWLGPALLISEEAAIYIVEQRLTMSQAVALFGVSSGLITMRLSVTGARLRVERRFAYPRRVHQ